MKSARWFKNHDLDVTHRGATSPPSLHDFIPSQLFVDAFTVSSRNHCLKFESSEHLISLLFIPSHVR